MKRDVKVSEEGTESNRSLIPQFVPPSKRTFSQGLEVRLFWWLSLAMWAYLVLNTFVTSVDGWIIDILPERLVWIVDYKSMFFVFCGILMLLFFPKGKVLFYIVYFFSWPIVQMFGFIWKVVYNRSANMIIALINLVLTIWRDLRTFGMTLGAAFVSASFVLLFESTTLALAGCILAIGVFVVSYVLIVRSSFTPGAAYIYYAKVAGFARGKGDNYFRADSKYRGIDVHQLPQSERDIIKQRLESTVIFNRLCLFAAVKLYAYQNSAWKAVPSALSILSLLAWSWFCFSIANFGLYKAYPQEFLVDQNVRFFEFVYYSFNNIVVNSTHGIEPIGVISRSLFMLQAVGVFGVVAVIGAAFVGLRQEKFVRENAEVIEELRRTADNLEGLVREEFGSGSINDAIESLTLLKSSLLEWILKITKSLDTK
jgi:hypothetical protein